jgi:filamentous hemagglutinin
MSPDELRQTNEYKGVMQNYGTGSAMQRGVQAATGALTALAGNGNLACILAGASAPELANLIGHGPANLSDSEKVIAHALLGGVAAALQGNSAGAGAAGAASGELVARTIAEIYYPGIKPSDLSEEDKQFVSNLATIASGLAGNLAEGNTAGTTAGAQAGKNAAENNALSDIAQAQSEGKTLEQKADEYVKAENERYKKENCSGLSAETCSAKMYDERREALKDTASLGADFVPVVGDVKGFAEADSAIGYLAAVVGLVPGLGDAAGKALKAAETALKKGDIGEASRLINQASDELTAATRPSHRQSEIDVGEGLGDGWREQVTFKDGKEVPYGTKGSVRPDWCQGNVCSVEVKNYNITTNSNGMINNISKQAIDRQANLPAGMRQEVVIDVRGQTISAIQEDSIIRGIVQKSNGIIKPTDIQFKR